MFSYLSRSFIKPALIYKALLFLLSRSNIYKPALFNMIIYVKNALKPYKQRLSSLNGICLLVVVDCVVVVLIVVG